MQSSRLTVVLKLEQACENGSGQTCFKGNSNKSDAADCEKDGLAEDKLNFVWREAFLKYYKAMDKELRSHPNLDCFCSGLKRVSQLFHCNTASLLSLSLQYSILVISFYLSFSFSVWYFILFF